MKRDTQGIVEDAGGNVMVLQEWLRALNVRQHGAVVYQAIA
jgi:hypothetical protein